MVSCSDDDAVDPYTLNYCYVYQPYSTYAQLEYKANGQFLVDISNPLSVMPVRLTKPASKDMNIIVGIDESLVAEYNEANGTDYKFLTGCSIINSPLKIKAGEYVSTKQVNQTTPNPEDETGESMISEIVWLEDSIQVSFGDMSGFLQGDENLILPIVITSADGATISKSSRIFLTFSSTYRANIVSVNYLNVISIEPEETGWESAYTNSTVDAVFSAQWNADDDIVINTTIDNSLIAQYNEENETDYVALPGTTLSASSVTMPTGSNSAPIKLTLGDYTGVAQGVKYLIPVKVSLQSGTGAEIEGDVAYILVANIPNELYTVDTYKPEGYTQLAYKNSWSGTNLSISEGEENMTAILVNANNYHGFETGDVSTIDLGETTAVDMFSFQFYAWYYSTMEIEQVQTSVDGQNWTDWGTADLGDETYWYVTFSKPAKFRYIRWTWGAPAYSSYYGTYARNISFYKK